MTQNRFKRGVIFAVEGADGSGKTTQVPMIENYLLSQGFNVVRLREPGGTPVGEKIRKILLGDPMDRLTELMLFMAARMEIIAMHIEPALATGKVVLLDRYLDSTYAYQGCGRGLTDEVERLEHSFLQNYQPNFSLFLEISLEESAKRLAARSGQTLDRFDSADRRFRELVRAGYVARATRRCLPFAQPDDQIGVRVDASGSVDEVWDLIKKQVDSKFIANNLHLRSQEVSK